MSEKEIEKFEIFYIRHADTSGAPYDDRSKCDIDLSPLGEKQIELLAKRFEGKSFDAVFSSPLVRAVKTAAAVCEKLSDKPQIEIMPELIENGTMPEYDGVNIQYLKRYYDNIVLCPDTVYGKNGRFMNNTDRKNDARARALIKYFRKRFPYGTKIAVFAHGSFGNHFIPQAVEMGHGNYILSINNTSVTKIKYTSDGKQRISFQNDFSHLRPIMENYEFDV